MKEFTVTIGIKAKDEDSAKQLATQAAQAVSSTDHRVSRGKYSYIAIYLDPEAVREHYEDGLDEGEQEYAPSEGLSDEQILKAVENLLLSSDWLWDNLWRGLTNELEYVRKMADAEDGE